MYTYMTNHCHISDLTILVIKRMLYPQNGAIISCFIFSIIELNYLLGMIFKRCITMNDVHRHQQ